VESGGEPRSYRIGRSVIIGRDPGCSVPVDDPQMSREHTGISFDGRAYLLRDLESRNGTRLNGAAITAPEILYPGDRIGVGRVTFVFELEPDDAGLAPELRVPRVIPQYAPLAPDPATRPLAAKGVSREREPVLVTGPGFVKSLALWVVLLGIFAAALWGARLAFLWAFEKTIPK